MKINYCRKSLMRLTAVALCFTLFSLSSQAAFAQGFSSLDSDLQALENLILDTIINTEEQQRLLLDLRQNLNESGTLIASYENIIAGQEILLKDLRQQLTELSETFRMQSSLSARYEQRLKFWRTFTLVGIPTVALISGGIVWAALR